jgi:hypothetical protein
MERESRLSWPAKIFRTAPSPAQSEAFPLVVYCSDPRYQPHFQDFLARGLQMERYALIAVPGGAQFLSLLRGCRETRPLSSRWRWARPQV